MREKGSGSRAERQVEEWRPRPSRGGQIGIAAASLLLAFSLAAWAYALGRPIAVDSFAGATVGLAGLLLAAFVGSLGYGCSSLRYRLGRRELTIAWLWRSETIPLGSIEGVYGGHRLGKRAEVEGVTWPGHYVGTARAEGLGRLKFYGTGRDPSEAIILATGSGAYAITPEGVQEFRDRLIDRLEALSEEEIAASPGPSTSMPRLLSLSLLRDGIAVGFVAAALLSLLISFGYVSARFPGLPELMPLHFNFAGEPDLIGPPRDAFRMPIIGLLLLSLNIAVAAAVHGRQRDAGRMVAAVTLFVELVMLVAVLQVVH